jgi:hypothetical protein
MRARPVSSSLVFRHGAKIEASMKKAKKVETKELKADTAEIEADAKSTCR